MNLENVYVRERITTAVLLAAGTGSRLLPLTQDAPKCMTMVNGVSILGRLVDNLKSKGFKRLIVVTGHMSESLEGFLKANHGNMDIEFVHSPLYKTTNNIYSLWKASEVIAESFVLLESDLVFDSALLDDMIYPDRVALASIGDWMNGTTVLLDSDRKVMQFKNDTTPIYNEIKYKTVNIYSFSYSSWQTIAKRLDLHIRDGKVNGYYETIFSELVDEGILSLQAVSFDKKVWYEIDTIGDLAEAIKLFPAVRSEESASKTLTYGAA